MKLSDIAKDDRGHGHLPSPTHSGDMSTTRTAAHGDSPSTAQSCEGERERRIIAQERQIAGAKRGGAATRAKQLSDPKYKAKVAGVRSLRDAGYSIRQIAEHYEVSYFSMRRFMKNNDIETAPVLGEGDSSIATEKTNEPTT